jgi:UDP-GlcNAc:undecaprenyl-phosphate GlcNAc-1-phosphate transferase
MFFKNIAVTNMSGFDFVLVAIALVLAVAIALLCTPFVIRLANRIGVIDTPRDSRRMHHHPIPMLGGLAIITAFFASAGIVSLIVRYFNDNSLPLHYILQLLPGAAIIAVMGFFDDKYNLPAIPRLFIQCAAAGIAVAMGVRITHFSGSVTLFGQQIFDLNYLSIPITVLWIVGMTNAVNWIDGLDGLAAGVCSISAFSILLIAIFQPGTTQLSIAVLTAALGGACLGFLYFNKHPAKIFMGDMGAMFLGYALSIISIQGYTKIYATVSFLVPLFILALPLLDSASAVIRRIMKGVSPTTADRSHIHHKLVDLGLSQQQAVLLLYVSSAALSVIAVLFSLYGTTVGWRFLVLGIITVVILFFVMLHLFRRSNEIKEKRQANGRSAVKPADPPENDSGCESGKDGQ